LDGNWVVDGAGKDAGAWTIETKADGVTKITHKRPNQEVTEFECATNGRECTVKDEGKTVKISRWFNGAKLVQMETRGHEIIQRKFAVVQPGDTLEMEVIPVSPQGKPETLHLRRAS
jgi:hypothetical protein